MLAPLLPGRRHIYPSLSCLAPLSSLCVRSLLWRNPFLFVAVPRKHRPCMVDLTSGLIDFLTT